MKRQAIFIVLACALLAGCGFLEQAKKDYSLHKETPYAEGEITAEQKTQGVVGVASGIQYVNFSTPVLMLAGPYFFGWLRGRSIRKNKLDPHPLPITGALGKSVGLEMVVQNLADVAAGLFEVGKDQSIVKRGWKAVVLSALGLALAPEAQQVIAATLIPALQNNPPSWLANLFNGSVLALVIGGLAAAEKWLSKVQPLRQPVVVSQPAET